MQIIESVVTKYFHSIDDGLEVDHLMFHHLLGIAYGLLHLATFTALREHKDVSGEFVLWHMGIETIPIDPYPQQVVL